MGVGLRLKPVNVAGKRVPPPSRGVASTRRKADERVIEVDLNAGERERAQQPLSKAKDFHELEKNLKAGRGRLARILPVKPTNRAHGRCRHEPGRHRSR